MTERDDITLLREFAATKSEAAFAALVQRHLGLVYSTALRSAGSNHAAEEIAQAVFIILAQKAGKLSPRIVLSGWLYQTTRLTAANFLRGEIRRQKREQEAYMQSTLNEPDADAWPQIAPLLDEALGKLGEADRNALVLRVFENKSLAEVGAALGASEDAAKMRVNRALEKLRKIFSKRGVALSATLIAGAVSASSVQAAPVGLAATISTVAITKGAAAGGSTLALVKGALKIMAWTKMKTAVVVGATILATGTMTTVVVNRVVHPKLSATDLSWADNPKYWELNSMVLEKLPPVFILRATRFPNSGGRVQSGNRTMGVNHSVRDLLDNAYGYDWLRIVSTELPSEKYDFLITLPSDPWQSLRTELQKQLGLTTHKELREVAVLQLRSKTAEHPGLKDSTRKQTFSYTKPGEWSGGNLPISSIAYRLEGEFGQIVTDHTGITGRYDFTFSWKWNQGLDKADEQERIRQALLVQLGLELVPSREPVEMLVVEKVK